MDDGSTGASGLGPPALLLPNHEESAELAEGYIELERTERLAGRWVIQEHRRTVAAWYLLLTHYRRALDGRIPPMDNAHGARREILSLGLCSSKAALDATLAGYYSVALASIRHQSECWFTSRYLECHPDQWPAFYERSPGQPKMHLPDPDRMMKDVRACNHPHAPVEMVAKMAEVWRAGSKGAHLTGEGMAQAGADEAGIYHVGPTFSLPMAVTAFSMGPYATYRLTRETLWVLRRDADGAVEIANHLSDVVDDAMGEIARLRTQHAQHL